MRLAQNQGLLTGPSLSPVQVLALSILDVLDRYHKALKTGMLRVEGVKNALIAAAHSPVNAARALYPGLIPDEKADEPQRPEDLEVREEQDIPDEETARMIEELVAQRGTVSYSDLAGEWQ